MEPSMSYDSTSEIDQFHRLAQAEDSIFELYRASAFMQNEAALEFDRVVTGGDARVPSVVEVRTWISDVVRGSLIVVPQPTLSWWRRTYVAVRTWVTA